MCGLHHEYCLEKLSALVSYGRLRSAGAGPRTKTIAAEGDASFNPISVATADILRASQHEFLEVAAFPQRGIFCGVQGREERNFHAPEAHGFFQEVPLRNW
jgi:hypothetical protein